MADTFEVGRRWNSETGHVGRRETLNLKHIAHMTLQGPTGCGKGVTIELVNLLGDGLRNCNVVSIDPTGQNYAVSWKWRSSFSEVLPLNPFHLHGGKDVGCNPLLDVKSFVEAMAVAEALMMVRPETAEPFFAESAQGLLAGIILHVVRDCAAKNQTPTLMKVRRILTDDLEAFAAKMAKSDNPQIASLLGRFQKESRTIDAIKQTADNATKWLLDEHIAQSLCVKEGESIDWTQLKRSKRPLSIYAILDADKLITFAPWLRLIQVSALNTLYRLGGGASAPTKESGRNTVFMMSEFAALGKLPPILAGLAQGRKYGVRFMPMVIQDTGQLAATYGTHNATTVIGNSGALLAFAPAPGDMNCAEFLSRAGGMQWVEDIRASDDPNGGPCRIDRSLREERIWSPDAVRGLPAFHGLVWRTGSAHAQPVYCPPYWEIRALNRRAEPDPYHHPAGASGAGGTARRAAAAATVAAFIAAGAWVSHHAPTNWIWPVVASPVVRAEDPPQHHRPPGIPSHPSHGHRVTRG
jgi:type IV secretory pathway TraG/TraD family ATPase VirD4